MTYLENYGPLAVLIYLRTQQLTNETSIGDADIDELFYLNLSQDFVRFMQRILSFYVNNRAKQCLIADERINLLITRIFPSAKELKSALRK
jgi:hypothetical protein